MTILEERKIFSETKLNKIKEEIKLDAIFPPDNNRRSNLCIYTTGSLARHEANKGSDLDIFVIGDDDEYCYGKLDEIQIFSTLIGINGSLGFPPFSNDGEFLKIFNYREVERIIGSPSDDHHNWFTARMLLILESKCIYNQDKYNEIIEKIIGVYLRDERHNDFKLYFLLNDILRFWRTLCLNYESSRMNQKKWEKKNISLKFSRRLTVFATIIYILTFNINSKDELVKMVKKTPWERLEDSVELFNGDVNIGNEYKKFTEEYMKFLRLKERYDLNHDDENLKDEIKQLGNSQVFKRLISNILLHDRIKEDLRFFLIS
ncbi:nucleotidyltransferase domain-containing protein [Cardiobacterium sp. Marseille-Q4385]|uniref:nucleotidyltransferase domain-containing protein n=1 Tax=Cardiobacterium sp. Marseille-Q4385 TaxID=2866573 RepID=UPI001CE47097|nr:nucleotidyltransferase domain-containing protein [Cardiobacterium sp. Marseille-Q4385]